MPVTPVGEADHSTLPDADAIVDPNQPGDTFASKAMAGVGVIFYLLLALRARRGVAADLASLLDLVAVGTVAASLPVGFNRIGKLLADRFANVVS